jgi:hypothetical protein
MKYRLWDTDINRLFGTFDTEDESLALVRALLESYGNAYANDLALGCEHQDGSFTAPLTGAALVERALRTPQENESEPGPLLAGAEAAAVRRVR